MERGHCQSTQAQFVQILPFALKTHLLEGPIKPASSNTARCQENGIIFAITTICQSAANSIKCLFYINKAEGVQLTAA